MIKYYLHKLLLKIGYRRFLYRSSMYSINLADFYSWEYRPDLKEGLYVDTRNGWKRND